MTAQIVYRINVPVDPWYRFSELFGVIYFWLTMIISVWLIMQAVQGRESRLAALLAMPPLAFTGRISYGLYLYHFFVLELVSQGLGARVFLLLYRGTFSRVLILVTFSFLLAITSWIVIERPFLRLKDRTTR
jgi:peptidoglycan/LPS O-acetylase OafA/YrhL